MPGNVCGFCTVGGLCRGGCARITKRHESSTPEGSRCRLIPVLSGLQECNYVTLQYKQVMMRVQPPLGFVVRCNSMATTPKAT